MFDLLFRTYPNELFLSYVLAQNSKIWRDNQFVALGKKFVVRHLRTYKEVGEQVHILLKLTTTKILSTKAAIAKN